MPRRNLAWLILIAVVSMICYLKIPANRYGRVLADALDHVSRHCYAPADDLQLFENSMTGMLGHLDEHSTYISASKKKRFEEDISKQFGGVGMNVQLDPKTKQITIISPLADSPAAKAGVRPGDKVLKIDGRSTQGMSLKDSVDRMHGEPDTPVTISVLHLGETQPVDITMVRKIIKVDTVQGDTRNADGTWNFMLEGHDRIGYIRITGFAGGERANGNDKLAKTTVTELKAAIESLVQHDMRGLVIDLRDNPGGLLKAAIEICNLFIPSGVIVTTRGRDGQILHSFEASGDAPYTNFPIAVLVNQHSASASEIVAACLQDHHRAVIVGQRSFGKGTVQEVLDLGDPFGAMKLTVSSYWRPSGQNIHHNNGDGKNAVWGVMPSEGYQVIVDDDELIRYYQWRQERDITRVTSTKDKPAAASDKPAATPSKEIKDFVDRPLVKALEYLTSAIEP